MKRNVGSFDRLLRALGAMALFTCSALAPLPLLIRIATFGVMGCYMLFTALAGSCFGYRLMGKTTCPVTPR